MRLYNLDVVLLIWFVWRIRYVIDLFFVFCRYVDRILRVIIDDYR